MFQFSDKYLNSEKEGNSSLSFQLFIAQAYKK